MAERALRRNYFHQLDAAGIEIDDLRVLDESRRDRVKQADLGEQPQGLGVVGDGARQSDQAIVALDDGDVDAGAQPSRLASINPIGPAPMIATSHVTAARSWCRFPHSLASLSLCTDLESAFLILHYIVIMTI